MEEFKGTKGEHKLQFVSGVCIGIGVQIAPHYHKMICNTILPDTDEDYELQKEEIEANMRLYAAAPELLKALQGTIEQLDELDPILKYSSNYSAYIKAKQVIKKALNL